MESYDGEIFKEVSAQAGIIHEGYGLGIHTSDFNNDGWLDIYVINDFAYDDLLYINQQDGTFKESLNLYFEDSISQEQKFLTLNLNVQPKAPEDYIEHWIKNIYETFPSFQITPQIIELSSTYPISMKIKQASPRIMND